MKENNSENASFRRFKTISHRQRLARFPKWLDLYRIKFLNGKHTLVRRLWISRCVPSMCWSAVKTVRFGSWIFVMVHRFCPYCICQVRLFNLSLYVATAQWISMLFVQKVIFKCFYFEYCRVSTANWAVLLPNVVKYVYGIWQKDQFI